MLYDDSPTGNSLDWSL